MKAALQTVLFVCAISFSVLGVEIDRGYQTPKPAGIPPKPDKIKTSYALGMNFGLQRKKSQSDADIDRFIKGFTDAYENKQTEFAKADIANVMSKVRMHGTNATAQEKSQFAYAIGMSWGLQLKDGSDIDIPTFSKALHDVTDNKPTLLKESEMQPLLEQGHQYALYEQGATNRAAGAAFLAQNAKKPGVHVLDGGLQYEVLQEGHGRAASTMGPHEIMFIKWKGMFLDGREFDHHNRYPNSLHGGWPCWIEALKRMKLGDKWRVYSPPEFAFGREGDPARRVGPDTTVIYDLEIREFAKDDDQRVGGGRLGHGLPGRDDP